MKNSPQRALTVLTAALVLAACSNKFRKKIP